MFQLCIARGFRAGFNQTFTRCLRDLRSSSNACRHARLPMKTHEHLFNVARRSFLNEAIKVQSSFSQPLLARYFSSSTTHFSEEGSLIYTGNLGTAVRGVKIFSYSSSGMSLGFLAYILLQKGIGVNSLVLKAVFCGAVGFFTFLTPILLHHVTKGYVVRLYHNADTDMYTAVTYSALLMEKKTVFHQSDVKIPDVSRIFTTFFAGKKGLLINPQLFEIRDHYNHLMGYDKPFSFDIYDEDNPDKS
ncbi:transmembrane protein 70, mitochondrial [Osmerus mordax]|uniref:transmembrane protein 70, mitochondrial n=1 Tax=Osmerus mordax TaxID=8014 RepID=UPI003510549B